MKKSIPRKKSVCGNLQQKHPLPKNQRKKIIKQVIKSYIITIHLSRLVFLCVLAKLITLHLSFASHFVLENKVIIENFEIPLQSKNKNKKYLFRKENDKLKGIHEKNPSKAIHTRQKEKKTLEKLNKKAYALFQNLRE